ncbi:MAG TPA: erythromycin esterase family protein [Burkholderiaceae bacterium]
MADFTGRHRPDPARVAAVRGAAEPLPEADDEFDGLLRRIGNARVVLMGEATHGSAEFYEMRARLTQRLVRERGFDAVAVEGDWPDAWRVNRFVRGAGEDATPGEALAGFRRFPTWMWRNTAVVDFLVRLRDWNAARPPARRCGFYGLDLYSMNASMEAVLAHVRGIDPLLAERLRERYACFEPFGGDTRRYGLMTGLGDMPSCEAEVVAALVDLERRRAGAAAAGASPEDAEAAFDAEQNAALVRDAERYYRTMYLSDVSSWNERDGHMARTLQALERHLSTPGRAARIVVWAHNSHVGDASVTEMGRERGEHNIGQLVRERLGDAAFLLGFTTHQGTVTAASDWDGPAERKRIRPSLGESVEGLMHATGLERFLLPLAEGGPAAQALRQPLLERAIGVLYRPDSERWSHYFHAEVARQFDALIHVDRTHAVVPLDFGDGWHRDEDAREAPETYPQGL